MNPKQLLFAQEYLKDPNAKKAAIKAGYSQKTAKEKGYQLLQMEDVKSYLNEKRGQAEQETGVSLKWCIDRLKDISDRCMQAVEVTVSDGAGGRIGTGEYQFDSSGANKATELIGRHLGIFEKDNSQKKPEITGEALAEIAKKINKNAAG